MGKTVVRYNRQRDPAEEARKQTASNFQQQRQAQASAYAAARFNEWQSNAQQREQSLQIRNQLLQSQVERAGSEFAYKVWKDNELNKQVTAYNRTMPAFQEQLKNLGITPGSDRYRAEMLAFAAEIPDAVTHVPSIQKELADFSKVDATAERITNAAKTLQQGLADAGLRGTSFSSTAEGNFDVKATRPLGVGSDEDLKALKLTSTEFLNHVNARQGTFDPSGTFTTDPKFLKPGQTADAIQFQAGTTKKADEKSGAKPGQLITHNIPLQQFNQIRSGLGVEPLPPYAAPIQQGAPAVSPTPAEMVQLTAPDGTSRQVPKDQADHYIKLGATLNQ